MLTAQHACDFGRVASRLRASLAQQTCRYEAYAYPNISTARLELLEDAKFAMLASLQHTLTALNGGVVMANGISM